MAPLEFAFGFNTDMTEFEPRIAVTELKLELERLIKRVVNRVALVQPVVESHGAWPKWLASPGTTTSKAESRFSWLVGPISRCVPPLSRVARCLCLNCTYENKQQPTKA
jgi:hypothetical protein